MSQALISYNVHSLWAGGALSPEGLMYAPHELLSTTNLKQLFALIPCPSDDREEKERDPSFPHMPTLVITTVHSSHLVMGCHCRIHKSPFQMRRQYVETSGLCSPDSPQISLFPKKVYCFIFEEKSTIWCADKFKTDHTRKESGKEFGAGWKLRAQGPLWSCIRVWD